MDIPGIKPYRPELTFIYNFDIVNPVIRILSVLNDNSATIKDLCTVVEENYHGILKDSFLANFENREKVLTILSNENFLKALITVLNDNILDFEEIICCNKIVYDYKCQKQQTPTIKTLMLELSHTVNKELVNKLSGVMDRNEAENLALVSRSSFRQFNNIKRANNFIIKYCEDITPQQLEYIYGYLYQDKSFKEVFNTVMFDVYDGLSFKNTGEVDRYNMVYDITMQIVNMGMTSNDIYSILINYKAACDATNNTVQTRFNITELPKYGRIFEIYNQLALQGIFI